MNNNDVLRRLRYAFNFNDDRMMQLFALGGIEATRAQVSEWLKKEDAPDFKFLEDVELAMFLNGFIFLKRGKKEGPQPEPEVRLNNNIILRKLKIALKLIDDEMVEILKLAGLSMSVHEITAFFRNPSQTQFRTCHDQVLRNFLIGLEKKYRKE